MKNHAVIEAKFIPTARSSPLPELFALRARLQAELDDLKLQKQLLRGSLAKKALSLKKMAHARGTRNGTHKEKQSLLEKAIKVDLDSKAILARSHQEGLETIRAVCLSVFGENISAQKDLLSARLSQVFTKLTDCDLSRVIVACGFGESLKTQAAGIVRIEECPEIKGGCAILETKSGRIEISVLKDLTEAFLALNEKLTATLHL